MQDLQSSWTYPKASLETTSQPSTGTIIQGTHQSSFFLSLLDSLYQLIGRSFGKERVQDVLSNSGTWNDVLYVVRQSEAFLVSVWLRNVAPNLILLLGMARLRVILSEPRVTG